MNKQPKSKVLINIILFVIFALFAVVQLNDPDPIHWFLLYGLVAAVSLTANYIKIPKGIIWILFTAFMVYAAFHFNYFVDWLRIDSKEEIFGEMVYEKPYLEGTREFLGLIMAALGLLFQFKK